MFPIHNKKQELPLRIYAHRGSNRIFPENTLPAFVHALEEQATHLEMDLHCTQDAHIVVAHDPNGKRTAGLDKNIKECSLAEIQSWDLAGPFLALKHGKSAKEGGDTSKPRITKVQEKQKKQLGNCYIPTFEEVLEAFPKTPFNVDIKDPRPEVIEKVVQLIHQRKDEKRIFLNSFTSQTLEHLQYIPYRGEIGISSKFIVRLLFYPPFLWHWPAIPGNALQLPPIWKKIKLDHPYFISRCHALGKRLDYWTINDPEEALRLLHLGADGIISDDVSAVKDAVFTFARQKKRRIDYA